MSGSPAQSIELRPQPSGQEAFVHLRLHSAYSLAEGALPIKSLPDLVRKHGMPALGVSDTNNLFGALEFSSVLSKEGIQPIIGCTLDLDLEDSPDPLQQLKSPGMVHRSESAGKVAVIAKSQEGYGNLMKLSSLAYRDNDGQGVKIKLSELAEHRDGLILLTGGRHGPIDRLIRDDAKDRAKDLLQSLADLFPGHLYVELQRHDDVNLVTEPILVELAYSYDLPIVATNEPYFATADMAEAHDALLCIAQGAYVSQDDRFRLTAEHYFKSPQEMIALFSDLPEAIENTLEIARRCSFMPKEHPPILPSFDTSEGRDESAELRRQAELGLKERLKIHGAAVDEKEYWDRLNFELDIIIRMEFPGYFLIVADFIKWAKAQDIPVGPGRGSGAGSIIAWALTITDLDPLKFSLLFERFLNPERVSMPDFDIDFCQDRRDEVIRYVQNKYGHDRVAQIITFGKLQARAVVRDVGRVLQMPYGQVDRICKLIPNNPANPTTLKEAIEGEPELQRMRRSEESVGRLMEIALKLEGLYRHASTHAAGVVIGDRPLEELVPTYRDPRSDMPVTQFNLKWVEPAGLVKFDFLGLKTLTVLKRAQQLLKQKGVEIDLDNLPLDDAATYEMIAKGHTIGVFQFESAGMQDLLRRARPSNIEDLIALVALFRPGPMENIPKYLDCKHGKEDPEFLHESVVPILADTYGVMIYQEQVMQVAQVLSGYSLGEADLLRRAMGKKIKAEMDQQKVRFVDGAMKNGVDRNQADYIFELVNKFAGYGFNKSHSACYALIAYQTAYLKANYPVEFLAAIMTLDKGNTDKLNVFKQDAQDFGIKILQPRINESLADFSTKDGNIVYALSAVKNVGEQAMVHLVQMRQKDGPFKDLFDFARRVNPQMVNKRALENLARAGAFDELNPNRCQVTHSVDLLLNLSNHAAHERQSSQESLFGETTEVLANPPLPVIDDWEPIEKLNQEKEAIGFFLSGHPLVDYFPALRQRKVVSFEELKNRSDRQSTIAQLAGVISKRNNRRSQKSDRPYAFIELSDPSGNFEVVVFSDLLAEQGDMLEPGEAIVVTTSVEWREDELRLTAKAIRSVEDVTANAIAGFKVFLDMPDSIAALKKTLDTAKNRPDKSKTRPGQVNLVLLLDHNGQEVELDLPERVPISPALKGALKAVPGVIDVQDA